jgi:hypothetical protein
MADRRVHMLIIAIICTPQLSYLITVITTYFYGYRRSGIDYTSDLEYISILALSVLSDPEPEDKTIIYICIECHCRSWSRSVASDLRAVPVYERPSDLVISAEPKHNIVISYYAV